ncbi:uncharacterized protein C7orf50 homolog [Trichogramma pretiosum]|uniref:uncharacterized protein C7orf50 homolog n=1 Tax=Trichogramma pretiosum TaxID=7493 RepID=UPI0006C9882E|nr:uncharacterized protein C7orf50 homolog [Trichogramma pretiosum]
MGLNKSADDSGQLQMKKKRKIKNKKVQSEFEESSVPESVENDEDVSTNMDQNESVDDCDEPQIKKKKKEKKKNKEDVTSAKSNEGDDESKGEPKKKEKSIRQIKKEKHEERLNLAREASKLESAKKALNYVSKWKHAKSHWKFEKLKQIWLMDNFLSDKYVPDSMFPTILEYFEGIKGLARQKLTDKATAIIKKIEDGAEGVENDEEGKKTTEYTRAKKLIEALSSKE